MNSSGTLMIMVWNILIDVSFVLFEMGIHPLSTTFLGISLIFLILSLLIFNNSFVIYLKSNAEMSENLIYTGLIFLTAYLSIEPYLVNVTEGLSDVLLRIIALFAVVTASVSVLVNARKFSMRKEFEHTHEFDVFANTSKLLAVIAVTLLISLFVPIDAVVIARLVIAVSFIQIFWLLKSEQMYFYSRGKRFSVMMVNANGILFYTWDMEKEHEEGMTPLFAVWLYSFLQIMTEFLDEEVRPEFIRVTDDLSMIFEWRKGFYIITITDHLSKLIPESMKGTANEVESRMNIDALQKGFYNDDTINELDEIVSKYFFYVRRDMKGRSS